MFKGGKVLEAYVQVIVTVIVDPAKQQVDRYCIVEPDDAWTGSKPSHASKKNLLCLCVAYLQ